MLRLFRFLQFFIHKYYEKSYRIYFYYEEIKKLPVGSFFETARN